MTGKNIPNISWIAEHGLCVGCGVCQEVCPQQAIKIEPKEGLFRPIVDDNLCINTKGCHRCRLVCPGGGIELDKYSHEISGISVGIKRDYYLGNYINLYTAYSSDEWIRFHSASGGMTSQFLIFLLEKGLIKGAVVTRFNPTFNYQVETFIATSRTEILEAKSSKYCPVSLAGIIKQIKKFDGKVAIVGLPCHIQGLRKFEKIDKIFRDRVFAYLGLYCSCGRSYRMTEYAFKIRDIKAAELSYFSYRDEGCLGSMVAIGNRNGREYKVIDGYQNYNLKLRSFFNVRRCMFCVDHFAELSDISFGDIHYGKYINDKIGINSIVTRRKDIDELLTEMYRDGYCTLEECRKEDLMLAQKFVKTKKHINPSFIKIEKIRGGKTPVYDCKFKAHPIHKTIKGYLVKLAQIWIGGHENLHWIVRKMGKDMRNWK